MSKNFVSPETWFSVETFISAIFEGWVIDGRAGGLLVGRPHSEGGIHVFSDVRSDDKLVFAAVGEFEGHEFIINPVAYAAHRARLEEINSFQGEYPIVSEMKVSPSSRVINTSSQPQDRLLWVEHDSFVVNKYATAMHLEELEKINESDEAITTFSYDVFMGKDE